MGYHTSVSAILFAVFLTSMPPCSALSNQADGGIERGYHGRVAVHSYAKPTFAS